MPRARNYHWEFRAKFRAHALGWRRSADAVERLRHAVAEVKHAAKTDPVLGSDGAATLIERIPAAFDQIDGSSGALGSAVRSAVDEMTIVITGAPLDEKSRKKLLERLWRAFRDDGMGYLDRMADNWGIFCADKSLALQWADRIHEMIRVARRAPEKDYGSAKWEQAMYGAMLHAGEYDRLLSYIEKRPRQSWIDRAWGFKALVAGGKRAEALRYAEASETPLYLEPERARACETLLLEAGLVEEAYTRYAMVALDRNSTNLATYRRLANRYPSMDPKRLVADLIAASPGREGAWFATAATLKLYDLALALAKSPADPKTLLRSATKHVKDHPEFAYGASVAALRWLAEGYGYELTVYDAAALIKDGLSIAREVGKYDEFVPHARACCAGGRIFWRSVRALLGSPFADVGP